MNILNINQYSYLYGLVLSIIFFVYIYGSGEGVLVNLLAHAYIDFGTFVASIRGNICYKVLFHVVILIWLLGTTWELDHYLGVWLGASAAADSCGLGQQLTSVPALSNFIIETVGSVAPSSRLVDRS